MNKFSKIKFLFCLFLLIAQFDFGLADDDEEGENDAVLQKGKDEKKAEPKEEDAEGETDSGKGTDSEKGDIKDHLQKKYEKIKKDKSGKSLKGSSGKIYQVVVETIREINPIRLLNEFNPEVILQVNGIDFEKFKIPVNYFSATFWTKFAKKAKMDKKEVSAKLKCDIEARKEGVYLSFGLLFKFGSEHKISIGDYLECFGFDLEPYQKKYDDYLVEAIRVPVQFIDEILTEGFEKYIKIIKEYVSANGGPMNAALKAYGDYSGKDIVAETKRMMSNMKNFNVSNEYDQQKDKYESAWKEYKIVVRKQIIMYYNYWFGKGGQYYIYQRRIAEKISQMTTQYAKMQNDGVFTARLKMYLDSIGTSLGPEGRAIAYIVYQPIATMFNQIFGPMMIVPKVMASDEDMWEKLLALPPVVIQTSGGLFKPVLMVVEPLLRLLRFLVTGEYRKSLSCGLDVAAAYGISIWNGAYKPKQLKAKTIPKISEHQSEEGKGEEEGGKGDEGEESSAPRKASKGGNKSKKRSKRDTTEKEDEKEETPEEASRYTQSDKKLANSYQGGPPPGGYKLGVKYDGKLDLDDEDFISRILLSPDFILKAGGPVYVPFASVLAPFLRSVNLVLFGEAEFNARMAQVPDIIRGVGVIGPLADVVQALLPFIKTSYLIYHGRLTATDVIVQTPSLVKQASNGILYGVYKNPHKLMHAMLSFLEGHGGILAMLKLQSKYDVPVTAPGATVDATKEFGEEGNVYVKQLGEFFGGWFLTYVQALGPIGSMIGVWFNGVLGNIIAPVKFLDTGIDLKHQPLKTLIEAFDDLPRMMKSAEDKRTFLSALLGGQDPDVLNEIGIDCQKLALSGIDPGLFLAGGSKALDPEAKKKLGSGGESVGINGQLLSKVDLNTKTLIDSGLLDANNQKLLDAGIDLNTIMNRVMRGSIQDQVLVMNAGISIKTMMKAGICPATLLAGGVKALPEDKLKAIGVNKNQLSEDSLHKLGLNPTKLHSKGIDGKKLATEGIEGFAKMEGQIGISVQILMFSVYHGMDQKKMLKAGININTMMKAGIDTRVILVGGLREVLKGDLSESSLARVGIDSKQILKMGININLLADVGAAVLNPMNLNKLSICPMSVLIGSLSRRGLDVLTGGTHDATSVSFGFVASILKISYNTYKLIPRIRELPYGKNIIDEDGRWTGCAGFFFYKIIGIDNYGGLLGFLRKLFAGKFTKDEIMDMINPIRILKESANPKKKPMARRRKENRKSVDDYLQKSVQMRVGQSRNTAQSPVKPFNSLKGVGSKIFGRGGQSEDSTDKGSGETASEAESEASEE